jgi:hypothetical protein
MLGFGPIAVSSTADPSSGSLANIDFAGYIYTASALANGNLLSSINFAGKTPGITLGPELVVNGECNTLAGWNLAGQVYLNGLNSITLGDWDNGGQIWQNVLTAGKTYAYSYYWSGNSLFVAFGMNYVNPVSQGTITGFATATTAISFAIGSSDYADINNVSVKEVIQNTKVAGTLATAISLYGAILPPVTSFGPELITNGDFSSWVTNVEPTGWLPITGNDPVAQYTFNSNLCAQFSNSENSPGATAICQNILTLGKTYKVEFDVLSIDNDDLLQYSYFYLSSGTSLVRIDLNTTGKKTALLTAKSTSFAISVSCTYGYVNVLLDNISVKLAPFIPALANLNSNITFNSITNCISSISANLATQVRLNAILNGTSSTSANITTNITLNGNAYNLTITNAALSASITLAGTISNPSTADGNLDSAITLLSIINTATATVLGSFTSVVSPKFDPLPISKIATVSAKLSTNITFTCSIRSEPVDINTRAEEIATIIGPMLQELKDKLDKINAIHDIMGLNSNYHLVVNNTTRASGTTSQNIDYNQSTKTTTVLRV